MEGRSSIENLAPDNSRAWSAAGRTVVPIPTLTYSDSELEALMFAPESDSIEHRANFDADTPDDVWQAICAFADDLPDHR